MTQSLKGRAALVTGGSRGIGAGVPIGIASSDAWAAAAADRMQKLGARAAAVKADQVDPAQEDKRVRKVTARFGHPGASWAIGTVLNVDGDHFA